MFNAEDVCNLVVDIAIISEHCYKVGGKIKRVKSIRSRDKTKI